MNMMCTEEKNYTLKMSAVQYLHCYCNCLYSNVSSVSAFVSKALMQMFFSGQMIEILTEFL